MKFKVGEIVYAPYRDAWGFVMHLPENIKGKTRFMKVHFFKDASIGEYTIGSLLYNSLMKEEGEEHEQI